MTQATLSYRKATPADAPSILQLVRSAYRGDASRFGWTTEADLVDDQRIDIGGVLAKINEPFGAVLVAHDQDNALVACCELLKRDEKVGYFGLFAVDPNRQAGGIGRLVLAEAEAYAKRTWGLSQLEMTVIWVRKELIDWYIRRGFTKTERTEPFPYGKLVEGQALRDDLYFSVLVKSL